MKQFCLLSLVLLGLFAFSSCEGEDTEWRQANEEAFREIEDSKEWTPIFYADLNSAIYYQVIKSGDEDNTVPKYDDVADVLYKAWLYNGEVFDKGTSENNKTYRSFISQWIRGISLALVSMKAGDKWLICVPYELAYGEYGNDDVPAYSTVFFELELVRILKQNN